MVYFGFTIWERTAKFCSASFVSNHFKPDWFAIRRPSGGQAALFAQRAQRADRHRQDVGKQNGDGPHGQGRGRPASRPPTSHAPLTARVERGRSRIGMGLRRRIARHAQPLSRRAHPREGSNLERSLRTVSASLLRPAPSIVRGKSHPFAVAGRRNALL